MNLLVEHATQASRIQAESPLLRAYIRRQVELARGMSINVAIETGDSQACFSGLAVVSWVKFFLREGRQQHLQAIELYRRHKVFEKPVEIIDGHNLAPGNISQVRAIA